MMMIFTNRREKTKILTKSVDFWIENLVSNTTSLQLLNSFQTFPQLKIFLFWLVICEWLGTCRLCFFSNEITTNVNANYWIKNERKSSKEFFPLTLVCPSSISLLWYISVFSCHLKLHFPSEIAIWEIRESDWSNPRRHFWDSKASFVGNPRNASDTETFLAITFPQCTSAYSRHCDTKWISRD